jgi:ubiquinone/menaquinone biosynthesis C-methylase UbiE
MDKPMSNLEFRFMAIAMKLRDVFRPRGKILDELGIKEGYSILDYGCGPGSYSIIAARLRGPTGKVYALDIHPMTIQSVQNAAKKKKLANIETILSDRAT